ncbi:flagellar hook-length control protein FliK [Sulfitobacter sp.]|uniref:flagellar hook-length control protein FliK n=1 Tax=Sulfitobacter sp. TaxID=1903071 RepID=UPI00300320FC
MPAQFAMIMGTTSTIPQNELKAGNPLSSSENSSSDPSNPTSKLEVPSGTSILVKPKTTAAIGQRVLDQSITATPQAQSEAFIELAPTKPALFSEQPNVKTVMNESSLPPEKVILEKSAASTQVSRSPMEAIVSLASTQLDQPKMPSSPVETAQNANISQPNPVLVSTIGIAAKVPVSNPRTLITETGRTQDRIISDSARFSQSSSPSSIPVDMTATRIPTPLASVPSSQANFSLPNPSENPATAMNVLAAPEVFNLDTTQPLSQPLNSTGQLRADLAPQIARQLAEVATQASSRPVEIALSPHELGRVRMSIVSDDNAITVSIVAERGETIDLMRRHIDQLGQTFRSMGYQQINFEFGQGAQNSDHAEDGRPSEQTDTKNGLDQGTDQVLVEESTIAQLNAASTDGVDIRL